MNSAESASCLQWAVAAAPYPGQPVSGDLHLVAEFPGGVLLVVIDGLGHGPEAAAAARLAADSLQRTAGSDLASAISECHQDLRGSRGVVLAAVRYEPGQRRVEWSGVGNVEAVLWLRPGRADGERVCIVPRGGVVGYQLPRLHVASVAVQPGDLCCLASDGIVSSFAEARPAFCEPERLAAHILERFGRGTDDAVVLAARLGEDGG